MSKYADDCAAELSRFFCTPGEPGDGWITEMAEIVDKYIEAALKDAREGASP